MPKFAANLSFMFSEEESLLDRFAAAREAGFSAVEYMFPYEEKAEEVREIVSAARSQISIRSAAGISRKPARAWSAASIAASTSS